LKKLWVLNSEIVNFFKPNLQFQIFPPLFFS
jgi:hypothetical protein